MRTLTLPAGSHGHVRMGLRPALVCTGLVVAALGLGFAGLCYGDGWSRAGDVLAALSGGGPIEFVVTQWRMPRVVGALAYGAALGLSGAIFQNLTRNPLGTPDMLGLNAGAYTGALLVLTAGSTGLITGLTGSDVDGGTGVSAGIAAGAVLGALAAGAAIYLLSAGAGFGGMRLVVIGLGVNAVLTAVNSWMILRADVDLAMTATAWSAGSLNGIDWVDLQLPLLALAVLTVAVLPGVAALHQLPLGDDVAAASGVRLTRVRVLLMVVGVGLTAVVTAACGPIVFVALAAPQIGRRLVGAAGVPLLPAALVGAVMLAGSDVIAQAALAPIVLPVGVVTTAVGGAYLIWLLFTEVRK